MEFRSHFVLLESCVLKKDKHIKTIFLKNPVNWRCENDVLTQFQDRWALDSEFEQMKANLYLFQVFVYLKSGFLLSSSLSLPTSVFVHYFDVTINIWSVVVYNRIFSLYRLDCRQSANMKWCTIHYDYIRNMSNMHWLPHRFM